MKKLKVFWSGFVERHPKLSQWVREGGLFFIVSNLITLFKYLILTFLPLAFAFMGNRDFGFPGINLTSSVTVQNRVAYPTSQPI